MLFRTHLSLYWNLENFCENMGHLYSHLSFILFISFFFFLFLSFFSFFLFFFFLMIASCLFLQQNFWERYQQGFRAFILMEPNKHILVQSQCRSRTFLDGSKWKACFCAYSQCRSSALFGGMYMILILRAW